MSKFLLSLILGVVLGFGLDYAVVAQTLKDSDPEICAEGANPTGACPYAENKNGTRVALRIPKLENPGDLKAREFGPYWFNVMQHIRKNWYRQMTGEQKSETVQIDLIIWPDGRVDQVKVGSPSGDAAFDQMALKAVIDSTPFKPFPAGGYNEKYLPLEIFFAAGDDSKPPKW